MKTAARGTRQQRRARVLAPGKRAYFLAPRRRTADNDGHVFLRRIIHNQAPILRHARGKVSRGKDASLAAASCCVVSLSFVVLAAGGSLLPLAWYAGPVILVKIARIVAQ